ncbi:hypothetical protein BaOVIS_002990 [Babesia ovis]|uniref:Kinase n=1 Tax=Babesia ovis TaxID=5869 RepID=A0A9W5T8P8_BABOV|nr:hypothetical protein BaOVIS_002990 [Babesia ovis]
MAKQSQTPKRHELEPFNRRQKKLSGTSLMLTDLEHRFVYKVIPDYNTSEAAFYCLVNSRAVSGGSKSYERLRETIRQPDGLAKLNVLPNFDGVVNVIQGDHVTSENIDAESSPNDVNYYDLGETTDFSNVMFNAIKLENLLHGYQRPAIIDIKLGIHNALDNTKNSGLDTEERIACVKLWQNLKMAHKLENSGTKRLYNITAEDLGLGEPFTRMDPAELHSLLKSWRQQIVASQTTEDELGFRICSISIDSEDGSLEISASHAKMLKRDDTLSILHNALVNIADVRKCMLATLKGVRNWVALQDMLSFSATSLLITYDQDNPHLCKVKWVDFTHVESVKHSPYSVLPGPSNMIKGIDQLISICENAATCV